MFGRSDLEFHFAWFHFWICWAFSLHDGSQDDLWGYTMLGLQSSLSFSIQLSYLLAKLAV
jgi:hypothetical protein